MAAGGRRQADWQGHSLRGPTGEEGAPFLGDRAKSGRPHRKRFAPHPAPHGRHVVHAARTICLDSRRLSRYVRTSAPRHLWSPSPGLSEGRRPVYAQESTEPNVERNDTRHIEKPRFYCEVPCRTHSLGAGGRRFESCCPDQSSQLLSVVFDIHSDSAAGAAFRLSCTTCSAPTCSSLIASTQARRLRRPASLCTSVRLT